MQQQINFLIDQFEKLVERTENEYKSRHSIDFNELKMKKYVNKKLRKERETLINLTLTNSIVKVD